MKVWGFLRCLMVFFDMPDDRHQIIFRPYRFLSVLLAELSNAVTADDIEALLPWNLTPEAASEINATYPAP